MSGGTPTDEQLTAAFKRSIGGPNPFYACVHCGKDFPGVRNELRDHWTACIERRHADYIADAALSAAQGGST